MALLHRVLQQEQRLRAASTQQQEAIERQPTGISIALASA